MNYAPVDAIRCFLLMMSFAVIITGVEEHSMLTVIGGVSFGTIWMWDLYSRIFE